MSNCILPAATWSALRWSNPPNRLTVTSTLMCNFFDYRQTQTKTPRNISNPFRWWDRFYFPTQPKCHLEEFWGKALPVRSTSTTGGRKYQLSSRKQRGNPSCSKLPHDMPHCAICFDLCVH